MKKILALMLACTLALSLAACTQGADPGGLGSGGGAGGTGGGSGDGGNGGGATSGPASHGESASPGETPSAGGQDAEYTIVIDGSDSWTPFADGGVTFDNEKSKVISISDDGKKVTFTGLAVGESTITAISGNQTARAIVKVVKRSEEVKYYLTYKDPIPVYRYELNGGLSGQDETGFIHYCDTITKYKEYMSDGVYFVNITNSDGYSTFSCDGEMDPNGPEYYEKFVTRFAEFYYWPCSDFAYLMANAERDDSGKLMEAQWFTTIPMQTIYEKTPELLPDQLDVSRYYDRSEKLGNISCDVFKVDAMNLNYISFYWVDPETGWTLQYARQDKETDEIEIQWTVTLFQIGTP